MNKQASEVLSQHWRKGATIIPFVGAGISADSGFPLIAEQRDYLAKTWYFIRKGIFRRLLGDHRESASFSSNSKSTSYLDPQSHPSVYIDNFGWPDLNQINSDFLTYFNQFESDEPDKSNVCRFWSDEVDDQFWSKSRKNWKAHRFEIETVIRYVGLHWQAMKDKSIAGDIAESVWDFKMRPTVDWAEMLRDLSEGKTGLVDALMNRFAEHRKPSKSHVMFAKLAQISFLRTILSVNFDPFLEQAFRLEGIDPLVFEVVSDSFVPEPALVRNRYSIVKLHGGTFGLRFDANIEYAIDQETVSRVLGYAPSNTILLVMGFSGRERRMMQLLHNFAHQLLRTVDSHHQDENSCKIIWLHYEPTIEEIANPVQEMNRELSHLTGVNPPILFERVADPGAFLLDLYSRCVGRFPKTVIPYRCLSIGRMIPTEVEQNSQREKGEPEEQGPDLEIRAFQIRRKKGAKFGDASSPSVLLSQHVDQPPFRDYRLLWIGLERHSTVDSVASQLLNMIRVYDPQVPMYVPPGEKENSVHLVVNAILRALRRGKYLVVFEYVEAFATPDTYHHGLPNEAEETADSERLENVDGRLDKFDPLLDFLRVLKKHANRDPNSMQPGPYGNVDWYLFISTDFIVPRHWHDSLLANTLNQKIENKLKWPAPPELDEMRVDGAYLDQERPAGFEFLECVERIFKKVGELNANDPIAGSSTKKEITKTLCDTTDEISKQLCEILKNVFNRKNKEHRVVAMLLLLCCFRRQRHRVAILYTTRWIFADDETETDTKKENPTIADANKRVERAIEKLTEMKLLYLENGTYRVPRLLKQIMYKSLRQRLANNSEPELCTTIFSIIAHSKMAKWYLRTGYICSKEIDCLKEYFYHRRSTLYLLRHVVELLESNGWLKQVADFSENEGELRENEKEMLTWLRLLLKQEVPASVSERLNSKAEVFKAVKDLRIDLMASFLKVLQEFKQTILSSPAPHSWVEWATMLLEDNSGIRKFITKSESKTEESAENNEHNFYEAGYYSPVYLKRQIGNELRWIRLKLSEVANMTSCVDHCFEYLDRQCHFVNKVCDRQILDLRDRKARELKSELTKLVERCEIDNEKKKQLLSSSRGNTSKGSLFLATLHLWTADAWKNFLSENSERSVDFFALETALARSISVMNTLDYYENVNGLSSNMSESWTRFASTFLKHISFSIDQEKGPLVARLKIVIERLQLEVQYASLRKEVSRLSDESPDSDLEKNLAMCNDIFRKCVATKFETIADEYLVRSNLFLQKAFLQKLAKDFEGAKQSLRESIQVFDSNSSFHAEVKVRVGRTLALVLLSEIEHISRAGKGESKSVFQARMVKQIDKIEKLFDQARIELAYSGDEIKYCNNARTWKRWHMVKWKYHFQRLMFMGIQLECGLINRKDLIGFSARVHENLCDGLAATRGMVDFRFNTETYAITSPEKAWISLFAASQTITAFYGEQLDVKSDLEWLSDQATPSWELIARNKFYTRWNLANVSAGIGTKTSLDKNKESLYRKLTEGVRDKILGQRINPTGSKSLHGQIEERINDIAPEYESEVSEILKDPISQVDTREAT